MQVLQNLENIPEFVKAFGVGRRPLDDPFLDNAHNQCKVLERKGVTIEDDEELCHELMEEFPCNACSATFQNLLDFELHYHDCHHYVCAECKKWRPTARLLEIHVQETHDNFFKVLAERQPVYQCFVSECDEKFKDPDERRKHCRAVHEFPKHYRFDDTLYVKPVEEVVEKSETMEVEESKPSKKTALKIQFGNNYKQRCFQRQKVKVREPVDASASDAKPRTNLSSSVTMFVPRQVQKKINQKPAEEKPINLMELEQSLPKL